ncbi:MAG TPA: hypothetical protein VFB59_00760 [Candidatus Saccharimonadales bacterium]|nr:hypothetical protein [Candidatus Saccharimonadales bacterium]
MPKFLISGVPGSGKSTVANFIEKEHGFYHIDFESEGFRPKYEFSQNPEMLTDLAAKEKIVISWGFGPFIDKPSIKRIIQEGFTFTWLDGDRVASFKYFMDREQNDPIMEYLYYGQMQMIVATDIVEQLKPRIVNPFTDSTFRPVAEIVAEILSVTQ